MSKFDVSFVVLTYNPNITKLILTIKSILIQKMLKYEIIISDDGSKHFPRQELEVFFYDNKFKNFTILENQMNEGTVINFFRGVNQATGQYIKGISPGDYISDEFAIFNWLKELRKHNADWSFAKYMAYSSNENNSIYFLNAYSHPQDENCYILNNSTAVWNYVVSNDSAVGATTICKKETLIKYLKIILYKVIYTEDLIFKLMMLDNINYLFYPNITMLYEFGSGISTGKRKKWYRLITKDFIECNNIILAKPKLAIASKIKQQNKIYAINNAFLSKLLMHIYFGTFKFWLNRIFHTHKKTCKKPTSKILATLKELGINYYE